MDHDLDAFFKQFYAPPAGSDPHFDDFFPFAVREGNNDVPFSKSRVYQAHLRSWSRRPVADNAADVKRLLPRLKALRKPDPRLEAAKNAPVPPELAALGIKAGDIRGLEELYVRSVADALWFTKIETADDMLLWHIVADANLSPRHWRELRAEFPKLAQTVEWTCRPGVNRKAGNKPGVLFTKPPTPAERQRIRARKKELLPQIVEAKKWVLRGRRQKDLDLQHKALERFTKIARSIRPTLADEKILGPIGIYFDKALNIVPVKRKPIEIVWYLIAKEFNTTIPHVREVLSRR